MNILETIKKNQKIKIVLITLAIVVIAYLTRKHWYYPKGITIKNINKKNKTVDVVFNYDGVLVVLNGYKADEYTDDIITSSKVYNKTEKSNYGFSIGNWEGITYFTIEDKTKDPKKGEMKVVSEIDIDWSKDAVPYDNTAASNAEYINPSPESRVSKKSNN